MNPELKHHFEKKGLQFVGQDEEGERMEVIELEGEWSVLLKTTCAAAKPELVSLGSLGCSVRLNRTECSGHQFVCTKRPVFVVSDHCYFVGVQFHPEFTSRPIKPSPPYFGLLLASAGKLQSYLSKGCRLSPR